MFISVFFGWWYKDGWAIVFSGFSKRSQAILRAFSVSQLLATLFAPWKRIISYPGASLSDKYQAWVDNIFSRTIGFIVRLMVIIVACLAIIVTALLTLIEVVIWPLLPPAVVLGVVAGILWKA
jgi:hypothetical protein